MARPEKNIPKMVEEIFLDHPHEMSESYGAHLLYTLKTAGGIFLTALFLAVHGLIPCLYPKTASERTARLHEKFQQRLKKP